MSHLSHDNERILRQMLRIEAPSDHLALPAELPPIPERIKVLCERAEQLCLALHKRVPVEVLIAICLMTELDCARGLTAAIEHAKDSVNWKLVDPGRPIRVRTADGPVDAAFFSYDASAGMVLYRNKGITIGRPAVARPEDVTLKADTDA
jgi:hypothetical protein